LFKSIYHSFLVIIVALCSITYELIFAQALTITFGGTVVRYSITIGLFLLFLGIGALLYRFLSANKIKRNFILVELALCVIGPAGLFFIIGLNSAAYEPFYSEYGHWQLLILSHLPIALVGLLSGLELPLLSDLSEQEEDAFSTTLGFDYIGSLIGSVLYAVYFYPELGLIKTAVIIGALNLVAAMLFLFMSARDTARSIVVALAVIVIGYASLWSNIDELEDQTYKTYYSKVITDDYWSMDDEVEEIEVTGYHRTAYQEVIFYDIYRSYSGEPDQCMNLDKHVQMCSSWVDDYHHGLIDVPMAYLSEIQLDRKLNVLLIGGGDWLPVKQLIPYQVSIDHVDIDKQFTELTKHHPLLRNIHQQAFYYQDLHTYYEDGFSYLRNNDKKYDLIVLDLPGLLSDKLIHFYSEEFFHFVANSLSNTGLVVTWGYPKDTFYDHYQVLMSTLHQAGFRDMMEYYAYDENDQTGETFYLLTNPDNKAVPKANYAANNYINKHSDKYDTQTYWQEIFETEENSNSIFHPNNNIIVKKPVRFSGS